jgi:hypothetical protein
MKHLSQKHLYLHYFCGWGFPKINVDCLLYIYPNTNKPNKDLPTEKISVSTLACRNWLWTPEWQFFSLGHLKFKFYLQQHILVCHCIGATQ